jgi:(E)-4-hydroxy-3-methylbut-2-enyl-diphosphate synthase
LLDNHPKWIYENSKNLHINKNTESVENIGNSNVPVVINNLSNNIAQEPTQKNLFGVGYIYNAQSDKWNITDFASDYVYVKDKSITFELPGNIGIITDYNNWIKTKLPQHYPLISYSNLSEINEFSEKINFVEINPNELENVLLPENQKIVILLNIFDEFYIAGKLKILLKKFYEKYNYSIIFKISVNTNDTEEFSLNVSKILGYLFTAGFGNGIMIEQNELIKPYSLQELNKLMFNLLQGLRERISKTEYIACPSCGRTLFDLQETTKKIKEKTSHLKGVKIGIMGCIVNGPGEMADADFGYVGTGVGKVSLYKGHTVVKRNIPEERAVDELIALIKEYGMYVENNNSSED